MNRFCLTFSMMALLLSPSAALAQQGDRYEFAYGAVDPSGKWGYYLITDPAVAPVGTRIAVYNGMPDGSRRSVLTFSEAQAICAIPHDGVAGWRLPESASEIHPTKAMEANFAWGVKDGVVGQFWRDRTNQYNANPEFKLMTRFNPSEDAERARGIAPVVCVHTPYKKARP